MRRRPHGPVIPGAILHVVIIAGQGLHAVSDFFRRSTFFCLLVVAMLVVAMTTICSLNASTPPEERTRLAFTRIMVSTANRWVLSYIRWRGGWVLVITWREALTKEELVR